MSEHDDSTTAGSDERTTGEYDQGERDHGAHGDGASRADGGYEAVGAGPTYCAYTDYTQDGPSVESLPATGEGAVGLERRVWDRLYEIDDPEMPVSIVDLGLIYGVHMVEDDESDGDEGSGDGTDGAHVAIDMTLTYTGCPARKMLTDEVREAVADLDGVGRVDLDLVWSPNWSLSMVTDQGRADLRAFGLSVPDPEPEPSEEAA